MKKVLLVFSLFLVLVGCAVEDSPEAIFDRALVEVEEADSYGMQITLKRDDVVLFEVEFEKDYEKLSSKFDDILDLLYQAVEKNVLDEENLIKYNNISLSKNELIELNNTIKYKIEDIINNRNRDNEDIQYDIVMASIPVLKKEVCN